MLCDKPFVSVFSNPILALVSLAALGAVIAGVNAAMKPKESIEDGFVDSEGNVISTPKGSINLDKDDDMIVGTNLNAESVLKQNDKILSPSVEPVLNNNDEILSKNIEPVLNDDKILPPTSTSITNVQQNQNINLAALESTTAAQLKENKEMNQNTKRLLRQNETLMRELITKTGNSSLANTV